MNQFYKDLQVANVTEKEISEIFDNKFNWKTLKFNDDNQYDLLMESSKGIKFTVEIKEDFTCKRTGNIGLEYSCRGKDSGIRVSKADFYCYKAHRPNGYDILLIKTEDLKKLVSDEKYFMTVNGGDPGSNSLNYLFKFDIIKNNSVTIMEKRN